VYRSLEEAAERNSVVSTFDRVAFRERLLTWWASNKREYAWRRTTDPYHLLVAEVLLHRTRADQVLPLYLKVLQEYPTIADLARAQVADVRKLLESAGLVWRVDMLVECARAIEERFGGEVPGEMSDLESLPGIGHYKASAIRCFAFGYPDAIVDTNTVRIASRLLGFHTNDSSRRSPTVRQLIQDLLDPAETRSLNLALLDFGALICRSARPLCEECPLADMCAYRANVCKALPAAPDKPASR
jgi:A/G-specific adenine glycosylase